MSSHPSTHTWGIDTCFSMERIPGRPEFESEEDWPEKERVMKVDYARPPDFCQAFHDHLDDFYTLSLLLTADRERAEQCVVSGLDDCLQGNAVFREWARSWARRAVIKNAIRLTAPLMSSSLINSPSPKETAMTTAIAEPLPKAEATLAAITSLPLFDRFVFVLSVLERFSDNECSILLECKIEKVIAARIRALQRIGDAATHKGAPETALTKGAA